MGMVLPFSLKVIFVIMGLYSVTVYGFVNRDGYFSRHKIIEVDKKIKHLRRHSLKTIQSKDGDIIDCIDIKKQPAFDHHALKDHKIQMAPTPTYNSVKEDTTPTKSKPKTMEQRAEGSSMIVTSQVWQKSGTCPEGTIPVRRIRKRDLLKAHSIEEYGRKKPSFSHRKADDQLNQNLESFLQLQNHSKAILFTDGYRYLGGKGDLKVCNPFVEKDDEYSTAQIALLNGAYNDFECIESGWAVNPSVYGDRQTRLFIYWTADASKKTGCFDLICPGFVQTSNEIALGAAIYPISIPGGLPYIINIYIYKNEGLDKYTHFSSLYKILPSSSSLKLKSHAAQLCSTLFGNSKIRADSVASECLEPLIPLMQSGSGTTIESGVCALERWLEDEHQDPITNNWWLQYGEKTNVGYWPPELFEAICYNAESVEWGGEVYSTRVAHSTPHTRTQMGNGHFATVYGEACSVSRMRIHDNSATLKIPEWVAKFSDEYYCYDVWYMGDYIEDPQLYYGGPGRNPMCP